MASFCCLPSITWFCCTATASAFQACCGGDKPSTVPPSVTSGRKRSVFLLTLAIICALGYQYGVSRVIMNPSGAFKYTPIYSYMKNAWSSGCELDDRKTVVIPECPGNNGVYRASFAAMLFFAVAAVAVACRPTANREAWPAKIFLFLILVISTAFLPNDPLFSKITLNIARIGAIIFIWIQPFIIIDIAYSWNESWVEKSDRCERVETGSGKKWLVAILLSSAILFGLAISGLVVIFIYFSSCLNNSVFIYLTFVFCILLTGAQLSGDEGSLLSSAFVSAWSVYLLYTAVTKNPEAICNPVLMEYDAMSVGLGLVISYLSMFYIGWSKTAEENFTLQQNDSDNTYPSGTEAGTSNNTPNRKVVGLVTGSHYGTYDRPQTNSGVPDRENRKFLSNSWILNLILFLIMSWTAMSLTQWGKVNDPISVANLSLGHIEMWIIIASQWIMLSLYIVRLLAPRCFPDRDFS